ncbi:MAG: exopolysaccharide Pel transporter PelG, partial [Planctomycetota bacterium]
MAGIGFRLQKILRENTFRGLVEAYIYSALISSGPWLLSIIGLALIGAYSGVFINTESTLVFKTMVIYTYMGTLIITGPIQMGTTRYIADRLFVNDYKSLLPCFQWVAGWIIIFTGIFAGIFYAFSGLSLSLSLAGTALFQVIAVCWTSMIFLSAAKDYNSIVLSFALGYSFSVVASLSCASYWGVNGLAWGFVAGQAVLTILLSVRIRLEFPSNRSADSMVVSHWKQMPFLLLIGFFYNAGIWIDKIIFWFSPFGEKIKGTYCFYLSADYDTCLFIAYCSIVPAMALFLIRIETGFYKHYAAFFSIITRGGTLNQIREKKQDMSGALRLSMLRLLKLQGGFTLLLMLFTPWILPKIGISLHLIPLMRISLIAAFLQAMLLFIIIITLYFDWQKEVMLLAMIFFFSNFILTLISIYSAEKFHGWG